MSICQELAAAASVGLSMFLVVFRCFRQQLSTISSSAVNCFGVDVVVIGVGGGVFVVVVVAVVVAAVVVAIVAVVVFTALAVVLLLVSVLTLGFTDNDGTGTQLLQSLLLLSTAKQWLVASCLH